MSGPPASLEELPLLLTRSDLESIGFGRRAVDALCRALPEVCIPGVRRVYLRRDDVLDYLRCHTYPPDRVRPSGRRA